jgi:deoxycytidine triphosphate deaminase
LLKEGKLKIEPLDPDLVDTTSVDIRIGNKYYEIKEKNFVFDLANDFEVDEYLIERHITDQLVLKPGDIKIVETLEQFELPDDLIGTIIQRHAVSITGVVVSGILHPGTKGHQKLNIRNEGAFDIILRPGGILCQIIFSKTEEGSSKTYMEKSVKVMMRRLDQVKAQEEQVKDKEEDIKNQLQGVYTLMGNLDKKNNEIIEENNRIAQLNRDIKRMKGDIETEYTRLESLKTELAEKEDVLSRDERELRHDFESKLTEMKQKEGEVLENIKSKELEAGRMNDELYKVEIQLKREKKELEKARSSYDRKNEDVRKREEDLLEEKKKLDMLRQEYEQEKESSKDPRQFIDIHLKVLDYVFSNITYAPVTVYSQRVSAPDRLCYSLVRGGLLKEEPDKCILLSFKLSSKEMHDYMARILPEVDKFEKSRHISYVEMEDEDDIHEEHPIDDFPYFAESVSINSIEEFLLKLIEGESNMRIVLPMNRIIKKRIHRMDEFSNFMKNFCALCKDQNIMLYLLENPRFKEDILLDEFTGTAIELDNDKKLIRFTNLEVPSREGTEPVIKFSLDQGIFTVQKLQKPRD